MNRVVLGIIGILAAALLVSFIMVAVRPRSSQDQLPQQQSQTPAPQAETAPNVQPGTYTSYTAEAFAAASGRRVLFFHAGWCPQCRELETSITNTGVPAGMTIFKVDYDTNTSLRQQYGVTLQTTVVEVSESGDLLKKHVAYNDPSLPAVLKALE